MTNLKGIEGAFCSEWSGWDEVDTGVFQFYDPVLHDRFRAVVGLEAPDYMCIDTSLCVVQFGQGDEFTEFKLIVSLGERK